MLLSLRLFLQTNSKIRLQKLSCLLTLGSENQTNKLCLTNVASNFKIYAYLHFSVCMLRWVLKGYIYYGDIEIDASICVMVFILTFVWRSHQRWFASLTGRNEGNKFIDFELTRDVCLSQLALKLSVPNFTRSKRYYT